MSVLLAQRMFRRKGVCSDIQITGIKRICDVELEIRIPGAHYETRLVFIHHSPGMISYQTGCPAYSLEISDGRVMRGFMRNDNFGLGLEKRREVVMAQRCALLGAFFDNGWLSINGKVELEEVRWLMKYGEEMVVHGSYDYMYNTPMWHANIGAPETERNI